MLHRKIMPSSQPIQIPIPQDTNPSPVTDIQQDDDWLSQENWRLSGGCVVGGVGRERPDFENPNKNSVARTWSVFAIALVQKRLPFYNSNTHSIQIFDLVCADILWTYFVLSINGHKYFLILVDDFSRFIWITLMTQISETRENTFKLHCFC
ncbi:hypothetical protein CR513_52719, partial [Mucuna pruriens]